MVTAKECSTTVGVFADRIAAERVIADLKAAGYRDDQIGMVAKDSAGKTVHTDGAGESKAGEGAALGAAAGIATGAAVGVGVLAGIIPVVGPAIMIGTLGTILSNALGGAAIAGITGALIGWGVPEVDAQYYESEVASGRYLVTVDSGEKSSDARGLFTKHGGYDRTSTRPSTH